MEERVPRCPGKEPSGWSRLLEGYSKLQCRGVHMALHVHPIGSSWPLSLTERWMAALKTWPFSFRAHLCLATAAHAPRRQKESQREACHSHFAVGLSNERCSPGVCPRRELDVRK